jgi:hypothetical protein
MALEFTKPEEVFYASRVNYAEGVRLKKYEA